MSYYNVFIENHFGERDYILAIDENQLKRLVEAYLKGEDSVNVKGVSRKLIHNTKFIIYSITSLILQNKTQEEIIGQMNSDKLKTKTKKISLQVFRNYGTNVSDDFTKGMSYGNLNTNNKIHINNEVIEDKIFVSHSSKNKEIVNKFCDLILHNGLNVNPNRIFNTSMEGSKPKTGEDFRNRIKNELKNAKVVLQFISKDYKKSEVCLNEMGAAWILSNNVKPLIVEKDEYEVGFIHSTTQQVQLQNEADIIRLADELVEEKIVEHYKGGRLNQKVREFISFIEENVKFNSKKEEKKIPLDLYGEEENPFFLINNHTSFYLFKEGFFHVIPDDLTRYYLGYSSFNTAQNVILKQESLSDCIGQPIKSIANGELWTNNGKVWLIYNNLKHHVANTETLHLIIRENKSIVKRNVEKEELINLLEGNVFDVKGHLN